MRTFTAAFEALPTREPLSHRERGRAREWIPEVGQRMEQLPSEGRKPTAAQALRQPSHRERQDEWERFAAAYSSQLPARVASANDTTHRVLTRTDKSAAEEPTMRTTAASATPRQTDGRRNRIQENGS
ncbi:hypothetical protein D0B54_03970 [Solimonas sp. K1W22B-7]|nr:hypothetical protein D0B54_03970 [Solimonas sp. K1W22B-7]